MTPPPALLSIDLHDHGYDISIGLVMLLHAPTLLCAKLSQTAHFFGAWRTVLGCASTAGVAPPLLCEHNLRVLPQMEHPCEHTIGARFYLPSLSTVWFAIFFHVFCIVGKKFPVAYPCRCLFFSVFFGNRLHLTAHFPVKNFMLASLSLYLLACFSVIFVLC